MFADGLQIYALVTYGIDLFYGVDKLTKRGPTARSDPGEALRDLREVIAAFEAGEGFSVDRPPVLVPDAAMESMIEALEADTAGAVSHGL